MLLLAVAGGNVPVNSFGRALGSNLCPSQIAHIAEVRECICVCVQDNVLDP